MPRIKSSSYNRRLIQLTKLGISIVRMRPYCRCNRLNKAYRVQKGLEKCVKCIRKGCPCDLAFLNIARWRRLEAQRKILKQQLRNAMLKRKEMQAKENRLLSQLEYVKDEQQTIINEKLQNLKEIAPLIDEPMNRFLSKSLIDVASKQIVFFNFKSS